MAVLATTAQIFLPIHPLHPMDVLTVILLKDFSIFQSLINVFSAFQCQVAMALQEFLVVDV
jgi:hypothetical protein